MSNQDIIISNNSKIRSLIHKTNMMPHTYMTGRSGIVSDLFECAMSYYNYKDYISFTYSGKGTLFDDDFDSSNPLIDCSSMIQAWLMGIPYNYSKYTGYFNVQFYDYGMTFPANPYASSRPNRYYANELAHYFYDNGYSFTPENGDYSNIQPGDIVFMSFENKSGDNFHENAFMKIDHCSLVMGWKDSTHLTCLHTTQDQTISFYDIRVSATSGDPYSENQYNNSIVLVARPPLGKVKDIQRTPIAYNLNEFTTTSSTSGLLAEMNSLNLDVNKPYTVVAHVENAYDYGSNSILTNYVGLRGSFDEYGIEAYTLTSWIYNDQPQDNIYYLHFIMDESRAGIGIDTLKLYVLNTSVAGHKFKGMYLYEGFVRPKIAF